MIRPIMRNELVLQNVSVPATEADLETARDLLDTLSAHQHECVGMAANMIGVPKRIIVFDNEGSYLVMLNPEIVFGTPGSTRPRRAACRSWARARQRATAPSRCATAASI